MFPLFYAVDNNAGSVLNAMILCRNDALSARWCKCRATDSTSVVDYYYKQAASMRINIAFLLSSLTNSKIALV